MGDRELTEDEVADLKEAFAMFDINGDGTFSPLRCAIVGTGCRVFVHEVMQADAQNCSLTRRQSKGLGAGVTARDRIWRCLALVPACQNLSVVVIMSENLTPFLPSSSWQ